MEYSNLVTYIQERCLEMTQKDKIVMLQSTISQLFEKEGRSISYIARLLDVDRSALSKQIRAWEMTQAQSTRLTPSNQKFANRHKQLIKSRYENNFSDNQIAEELNVSRDYLRNIVAKTPELHAAQVAYVNRLRNNAAERRQQKLDESSREYDFPEIDGEEWKEIMGYPGYFVSNKGRVKKYVARYKTYHLMQQSPNCKTGRMYVWLEGKGLQVSRLVGFAFVEGHSEDANTIEHRDGDVTNNDSNNLVWVSQATNNALAYQRGRVANKGYQRNGKFKKVVVDGKYEFKSIAACAKFLNISVTQLQRYLSGETKSTRKITLVY